MTGGGDPLAGFPVRIDVPVAWGDMDAFEHVNNTVYFRWFESARIAYFRQIGFEESRRISGIGPILASTRCRFRLPLAYPDVVEVAARARDLAEDRFVMDYRVASREQGALAAEGEGLIVCYDYRRGAKVPIPASVRRRLEQLGSGSRA